MSDYWDDLPEDLFVEEPEESDDLPDEVFFGFVGELRAATSEYTVSFPGLRLGMPSFIESPGILTINLGCCCLDFHAQNAESELIHYIRENNESDEDFVELEEDDFNLGLVIGGWPDHEMGQHFRSHLIEEHYWSLITSLVLLLNKSMENLHVPGTCFGLDKTAAMQIRNVLKPRLKFISGFHCECGEFAMEALKDFEQIEQ